MALLDRLGGAQDADAEARHVVVLLKHQQIDGQIADDERALAVAGAQRQLERARDVAVRRRRRAEAACRGMTSASSAVVQIGS